MKAIQNLKIDRVTVWDTPNSGQGTTANFLKSLITSVPAIHDLAKQVGVELPEYFGTFHDDGGERAHSSRSAPRKDSGVDSSAKEPSA